MDDHSRLMEKLSPFHDTVYSSGAAELDDLRAEVTTIKKRFLKFKKVATERPDPPPASTPTSSGTTGSPSDYYQQTIRAKTIPLPTFEGGYADWRTFWCNFIEYIGKIRGITDREKFCYLKESIKDPAASDVVKEADRNGDSFSSVGDRLSRIYDQPREVYMEALKELTDLPLPTTPRRE